MVKFFLRLSLVLLPSLTGLAQSPAAAGDSTLGPLQFFEAVARFHPVVLQANLFSEAAAKELQMARGFFDPKANMLFNRKSFNGKDYYNLFNPELKIPTWPGLDIKAGLERNVGTNVNGEDQTPAAGLQYVGVSLPLGQGLFTDARRTVLNQAKIGLNLAEAERLKLVNKVLFTAAKDYWDWYFFREQLNNAEEALRLAKERYQAVVQRIILGDLAPIDSVEAFIFLQDRDLFFQQSRIEEWNSRTTLSTHLWSANAEPLDIKENARAHIPLEYQKPLADTTLNNLIKSAQTQHPELQKIRFKLDQLDLDRRLSIELFKPTLNVNYTWLSQADNSVWATQSLDRNYKLGVDFGIPLFLRKERGKLGLVKTKIFQNQLELTQTRRTIEVDIRNTYNTIKTLENLITVQQQMVNNYKRLRDAEVRKFENGESSLFLINSRESKLIESQVKLASLLSKFQKEKAAILYVAGRNPFRP